MPVFTKKHELFITAISALKSSLATDIRTGTVGTEYIGHYDKHGKYFPSPTGIYTSVSEVTVEPQRIDIVVNNQNQKKDSMRLSIFQDHLVKVTIDGDHPTLTLHMPEHDIRFKLNKVKDYEYTA